MTRAELIEAGMQAAADFWGVPEALVEEGFVTAVIDAVGPLLFKAAEEHVTFLWGGRGWVEHRDCGVRIAELRAQVETLQAQPFAQVGASGWDSISRADVLALLDGSPE